MFHRVAQRLPKCWPYHHELRSSFVPLASPGAAAASPRGAGSPGGPGCASVAGPLQPPPKRATILDVESSQLSLKTKAQVFLCSRLGDRFGIDCCGSVPHYSQNGGRPRLELSFFPLYTGKALLATGTHDPNSQHVSGPSALVNFYC